MVGLLDQPVVLAPVIGAIPHKGDSMFKVPFLPFAVRLFVHSCTMCSAIAAAAVAVLVQAVLMMSSLLAE